MTVSKYSIETDSEVQFTVVWCGGSVGPFSFPRFRVRWFNFILSVIKDSSHSSPFRTITQVFHLFPWLLFFLPSFFSLDFRKYDTSLFFLSMIIVLFQGFWLIFCFKSSEIVLVLYISGRLTTIYYTYWYKHTIWRAIEI